MFAAGLLGIIALHVAARLLGAPEAAIVPTCYALLAWFVGHE